MINKISYKKILEKADSPTWLCYYDNKVASYIVYCAQRFPLTANQISVMSLIVAIAGSIGIVVFNSALIFIIGVALAYTLDNVDGIWARVKKQTSFFGEFLDQYLDHVKEYLFEIAIMIYYIKNLNPYAPIYLFFICYFSIKGLYYLSVGVNKKQLKKKVGKLKVIVFGSTEKYLIVFPLIIYVKFLIGLYFLMVFLAYVLLIYKNVANRNTNE
jgi:phosphatidylglycerophosphate synthase